MKKVITVFLLTVSMVFSVSACGFNFNEGEATESVQVLNPIPVGEYIVLDIREQVGGNNIRVNYYITVVLQNEDGDRYFYEYNVNDKKNSTYINLAKLVPNDKVIYQDGTLILMN